MARTHWTERVVAELEGRAAREETRRWLRDVWLPDLQRRASGLDAQDGANLARFLDACGLSEGAVLALAPHQVAEGTFRMLQRERDAAEEARLMPLLAEAQAAPVTWRWVDRSERSWQALGRLGPFYFDVWFARIGFDTEIDPEGTGWRRDWGCGRDLVRVSRIMSARGQRTGLFPKIDATLRAITTEFLDQVQPSSLEIIGLDAKRNAHNARHYGVWAPEGYEFLCIPGRGNHASDDGVIGVAFRRLAPILEHALAAPGMR